MAVENKRFEGYALCQHMIKKARLAVESFEDKYGYLKGPLHSHLYDKERDPKHEARLERIKQLEKETIPKIDRDPSRFMVYETPKPYPLTASGHVGARIKDPRNLLERPFKIQGRKCTFYHLD